MAVGADSDAPAPAADSSPPPGLAAAAFDPSPSVLVAPPEWIAATISTTTSAASEPAVPSASRLARSVTNGAFQRGGGPGKPAATRASSCAAQAGSGAGRTSRSSVSRSGIDGLPKLGHGAVQERPGVRCADAEDGG